jgi:hypothetical protein
MVEYGRKTTCRKVDSLGKFKPSYLGAGIQDVVYGMFIDIRISIYS